MQEHLGKAKNYAFRLLKIRWRSRNELEQKLKQKNFSQEVISAVIETLTNLGYIDDLRFAKAWVNNRLVINPRSRRFLIYELKKKGIDENIIEEAVSRIDDATEYELVAKIAQRKFNGLKKEPLLKIKQRLFAYLKRRGFRTQIIMDIIKKLMRNEKQ